MAKAEPSSLSIKVAAAAVLALIASACARGAAELPPETITPGSSAAVTPTPAEMRLTCAQVQRERASISNEERELEAKIKVNRENNQAAVFFAGAAGAALAEHNDAEKRQLDGLQQKRDRLNAVARQKAC
jgi:hypothetical protein